MSKMLRFFLLAIPLLVMPLKAHGHTIITRMSDRAVLTVPQLTAAVAKSDLILMGELHDDPDHHDLQLNVIRSLFENKTPMAIGLEMMQASYQDELDQWTAGKLSEPAMAMVFQQNWSDWPLYRDIFVFARDNHIPMVALNVPEEIVRKVALYGFTSLSEKEKRDLPEGTSCDLKNPQIAVLRKTFRSVAAHLGEGKRFNNFCEAQTVRNSGMAIRVARYLKKHPGQKLVGLTGIMHAIKYAIPDQLERFGSKVSYTVILPVTSEMSTENSTTSEADYLVEL